MATTAYTVPAGLTAATPENISTAYQSYWGRVPTAEETAYWTANGGADFGTSFNAAADAYKAANPTVSYIGTSTTPTGGTIAAAPPATTEGTGIISTAATPAPTAPATAYTVPTGLNTATPENITTAYQSYWGRPPSTEEAAYWTANGGTNFGTTFNAAADAYKAANPSITYSQTTTPAITPAITPAPAPATSASEAVANEVAAAPVNVTRDITAKETVSGQLNDLLNEDSTYMQSAKANAMTQANSRGLINSSMAVGAGQKAAIDASLPIAQQDATTYSRSGELAQTANNDVNLTGFKSLVDSAQGATNFGYRTAENQQNIDANKMLQDDKQLSDLERQTQQEASQRLMQSNELGMQQQLKSMDINMDLTKLDSTQKTTMIESFGRMSQQRTDAVSRVNAIPTEQLAEADKARWIDQINSDYRNDVALFSSIFGASVSWSGTTPSVATAPASGGVISTPGASLISTASPSVAPAATPTSSLPYTGTVTSATDTLNAQNAANAAAAAAATLTPVEVMGLYDRPPETLTPETLAAAQAAHLFYDYQSKKWVDNSDGSYGLLT